jgi:L-amino acid N-acyltransferase YncA
MSSTKSPLAIRDSDESDVPVIQDIYSYHVQHGTASFELTPPSVQEMQQRRADVVAKALPYLVAEIDGVVVGYAYATMYRPRPAYRFTVEDSVYVREGLAGHGIGRALLDAVIKRCTALGYRQMLAVIGDSSPASVALHKAAGFVEVGLFRSVGFKFGQWRNTAMLERELGEGSQTPPAAGS